jgi:hypothetical protein
MNAILGCYIIVGIIIFVVCGLIKTRNWTGKQKSYQILTCVSSIALFWPLFLLVLFLKLCIDSSIFFVKFAYNYLNDRNINGEYK